MDRLTEVAIFFLKSRNVSNQSYVIAPLISSSKKWALVKSAKEATSIQPEFNKDRVKRIWYLSPMRAAKVQASLRIRAVSPEPSLLAHTSSESRGTFRQKARSLVPLNGWACAVKICHDGMLEDTNSLDGAHNISHLLKLLIKTINLFNVDDFLTN